MAGRYPIVVQGEASETDSDDEVYITSLSAPQTALIGAKVPGEASETDSEDEPEQAAGSHDSPQILKRDLPPLIVVRDHPDMQSILEDRPSPSHRPHGDTLLQQKLQESNSRLYSDVGQTLRQVYGNASRERVKLHTQNVTGLVDQFIEKRRKGDRAVACKAPVLLTTLSDSAAGAHTVVCHSDSQLSSSGRHPPALQVRSTTSQLNASQSAIINASHSIRLILDDLKAVSEKIDIITSCQILPDININNLNNYTAP